MPTVRYPFDTDLNSITVTQSPNGDFSHSGHFASGWDFALSSGTDLLAVGHSRVIAIEANVAEGEAGPSDLGNYVTLSVFDTSASRFYVTYMHLEAGSTLEVGDRIRAGEVIGQVGLTGYSTGYHLHIQASETLVTFDSGAMIADGVEQYAGLMSFHENASGNAPHYHIGGRVLTVDGGGGGHLIANLRTNVGRMPDDHQTIDLTDISTIYASRHPDSLIGDNSANRFGGYGGNDLLRGGGSMDTLNGGSGDDRLFGNRGRDSLDGGNGRDYLVGGRGDDFMDGGAHADTFVFSNHFGNDNIRDFGRGQDQIVLIGFDPDDVRVTRNEANTVLHLSERDSIEVWNLSYSDIVDHIIFA